MNAREFFERLGGAPEAPPTEAPTAPAVSPERPQEQPSQPERPDPWRRRDIDPTEEPHPKAAYGMDTTYSEAATRVVSNMLEDEKGI